MIKSEYLEFIFGKRKKTKQNVVRKKKEEVKFASANNVKTRKNQQNELTAIYN